METSQGTFHEWFASSKREAEETPVRASVAFGEGQDSLGAGVLPDRDLCLMKGTRSKDDFTSIALGLVSSLYNAAFRLTRNEQEAQDREGLCEECSQAQPGWDDGV
jgi:hypothetical protein